MEHVFVGVLIAIEVCINFSPFFFCINTRHKVAGNLVGLLYAGLWIWIYAIILEACADPIPGRIPNLVLVVQIPTLLCLAILTARFAFMLIKALKDRSWTHPPEKKPLALEWHINYVKDLLTDQPERYEEEYNAQLSCWGKFQFWWSKYVWTSRPNFQYSTRIVCTVFVVFCVTYQLGITFFWLNTVIIDWVTDVGNSFLNLTDLPDNATLVVQVRMSIRAVNVTWDVVSGVSLALFAIDIIVILGKYRKDMLRLYRGDRSFLPIDFVTSSQTNNAEVVRNCMLFSGFQIAFMIWGFFILTIVLWILSLLVVFIIVLPLTQGNTSIIQWIAEVLIIPLAMSFAFRLGQKILASKVFLQDKIHEDDQDKPLALDNPRFFHIINYLFFIANIQTGLFSCLFRIIKGLLFGLIYLGRMDRCVLMGGYEGGDKGYMAYLGMLYVEHAHNNPLLRVFCQAMLDVRNKHGASNGKVYDECQCSGVNSEQLQDMELDETAVKVTGFTSSSDEHESHTTSSPTTTSPARRRWLLTYTLINNPTLVADRRPESKDELDTIHSHTLSKEEKAAGMVVSLAYYQQYLRVRERAEAMEKEVYGRKVKKSRRISESCQVTYEELMNFESDVNEGDRVLWSKVTSAQDNDDAMLDVVVDPNPNPGDVTETLPGTCDSISVTGSTTGAEFSDLTDKDIATDKSCKLEGGSEESMGLQKNEESSNHRTLSIKM